MDQEFPKPLMPISKQSSFSQKNIYLTYSLTLLWPISLHPQVRPVFLPNPLRQLWKAHHVNILNINPDLRSNLVSALYVGLWKVPIPPAAPTTLSFVNVVATSVTVCFSTAKLFHSPKSANHPPTARAIGPERTKTKTKRNVKLKSLLQMKISKRQ